MSICKPEILLNKRNPGCRISVILLDWGVRESFHSLDYLNRQTVRRDRYELIWLEFYNNRPQDLQKRVAESSQENPVLDKWIVAGYPSETIFNKHRLYNLGILAADGDICVICDSDAIFTPNFIAKIEEAFTDHPNIVLHIDEIRNHNHEYYPFCYPSIQKILAGKCYNWHGTVSKGLDNSADILHEANYGACMAAKKADLLAVGGADEHLDYLGYICGPYELTFRLENYGRKEIWLRDEYIYHTWHPNENGINSDYQGPHDGRCMSLLALESRVSKRVQPNLENPWIAEARQGQYIPLEELMHHLEFRDEPEWRIGNQPAISNRPYWMKSDYLGFHIFLYKNKWFALKKEQGIFDPQEMNRYYPLLTCESEFEIKSLIQYYDQLPKNLLGRIFSQPLYRLPLRIASTLRRQLARFG